MSKMQQSKTVKEFSTFAATQFLRTAVFIDDRIYNQKTKAVEPEKPQKSSRKLASRNANTQNYEKLLSSPEDTDENKDFPSQQLVNSFAKKQIVCSLYQPGKSESFSNDSPVYELCLASDIVIIDWDLGGNPGEKALELISCLVHESVETKPEQLRLILVYTSESDLGAIAVDVFDKLTKISKEDIEPQKEDGGLSMHSSNSRVVVLGKPGHRIDKYKSHEVPEKELAQKAISEFSKLASGLLQGAILLGLAKIRENSRKVLSKFGESIDTAFLLHRALSLPHEEAFEHIHPLLVAEIQSILQDCLPGQIISDNLVSDWALNKWKVNNEAINLLPTQTDANEFVKNLFVLGPDIGKKTNPVPLKLAKNKDDKWEWSIDNEKLNKLLSLLLQKDNKFSNHKLAILMSHRTSYGNIDKSLTLGTIIRKGTVKNPQYLLCLLPICDTVRLNGKRRCVFCLLDVVNEGSSNKKKANYIIEDENGFRELLYTPKSFNCISLEFEPDSETETVVAKKDIKNNLSFICETDNERYKWIAQLKPEHAQRAAEQFASNLSRVGLTESEWLRLMSK
jgi:hypothetical protein